MATQAVSMTVSITTGPGVRATIELTNTGDEAAHNVTPVVVLGNRDSSGERTEQMPPNAPRKWEVAVQEEDLATGSYVAVTSIQYEDANGYPFEVLAITPFVVGTQRRAAVGGTLALPRLAPGSSADGKFSLKLPESRGRKYEVRFISPRGATISPERQTVEVDPAGAAEITVRARNSGLLAGNHSAAFVLISSLDETPPQTDAVRAIIRAGTSGEGIQTRDFLAALTVLAVALVVLELVGGLRRRHRTRCL